MERREIIAPNGKLDLLIDEERLLELSIDGVAEQLVGIPTTKLLCYTGVGISDGHLVGKAVCRITIPTGALVDLARKILEHVDGNKQQIAAAMVAYDNMVVPQSSPESREQQTKS
jgi:hypothetical protein